MFCKYSLFLLYFDQINAAMVSIIDFLKKKKNILPTLNF